MLGLAFMSVLQTTMMLLLIVHLGETGHFKETHSNSDLSAKMRFRSPEDSYDQLVHQAEHSNVHERGLKAMLSSKANDICEDLLTKYVKIIKMKRLAKILKQTSKPRAQKQAKLFAGCT